MSKFNQTLFSLAWLAGFFFLLSHKGVPKPAAPDPQAMTDVILQPFLSALWGLVGYGLNAIVFAVLVVFAVNIFWNLVSMAFHSYR